MPFPGFRLQACRLTEPIQKAYVDARETSRYNCVVGVKLVLVLGESERTDRVDSTGAIGIELVKHFLQILYRKAKVARLRAPMSRRRQGGSREADEASRRRGEFNESVRTGSAKMRKKNDH